MLVKLRHLILILIVAIAIISTSIATAKDIDSYLIQGKQYYDRGQYSEALQLWQQVVNQDDDIENKIIGYNYQAIAYQDLAEWEKSAGAIERAFDLLENVNNSFLYAQVSNTKGSLEYKTGEVEDALQTWQQAEVIYRDLNGAEPLLRSQINQAQALRSLGFYPRAKNTLETANEDLNKLPDSLLKAKALQSLGVTLRAMGDLSESEKVLKQSLNIASQINAPTESIKLSLANTAKVRQDYRTAQTIYKQIRVKTSDLQTKIKASLDLLDLLITTEQTDVARELFPAIASEIDSLSLSLNKIYNRVNLAHSFIGLDKWHSHQINYSNEIKNILIAAKAEAEKLNNDRAKSYVLGELGYFYEQQQQWIKASEFTQQAILLAQNIRATDIVANTNWQQGRILKALGKIESAIAAYQQAVNNLQSLRQDLVAVSPDVRFDYRDEVEPVYRQLVQLLLQDVDSLPQEKKQEYLQKSREAIEALQLAELENYFRQACVLNQPREIEEIDPEAAVIYPILLEDRLEVILSLPNQPLQYYGSNLTTSQKEQIFRDINQTLNPVFLPDEILPPAQQLYDWLIRPGKASLEQQEIKTLVFVLDDLLRNIPMSVLHDGENYLIEQYDIALTPGLQLLAPAQDLAEYKTLTGGLTIARQGFPPLPSVKQELKQINTIIPAQVLIDEEFTRSDFQTRTERETFSTIHLATHGQFSTQAEDTFLLTWADRINVKDLDSVLRQQGDKPLDLLVLSACETAEGDNRAALGMAGVAVRSGARSTVASLWTVEDDSTALLMREFYRNLIQAKLTKAEALRQAQLSLLNNPQYNHPYYWSSFVLIGNWL
ncbi:CHAT domain-containing protein [Pleurocapsa sp. PCC 7319]|uniref:CHAT domain-containing protein n=1 Tax=Pleurocapsa sp. PCC 7319 TaxID=118161 RepID=UPI0003456B19|nr:CHAT domain-containing protein [Pleurocapsa sp. PCC 7319]